MSRTLKVGTHASDTSMLPSNPARRYPPTREQIPPRIDKRSAFEMTRSVSHESGWNHPSVNQPMRVGVVQPQVKPQNIQQKNYAQPIHKEIHEPIKVIPPRPPREPPIVERTQTVDPWRLLPEQKKYYIDEFYKLQRDPTGVYVAGPVARDYFLKSKLPNDELIVIWELADLDQDGSLTRIEFCLAFHLTLARRKGYQLPTHIPETLFVGLADLQEPVLESPDDQKVDDDNWETFSEKSFSTVSSVRTLPHFADEIRDSESMCQPEPLRMTPKSMAARNVHNPYERRRDEMEMGKPVPSTFSGSSSPRDTMDSTHGIKPWNQYLNRHHQRPRGTPDGSSSAQSTSSSSSPSHRSDNSSENLSDTSSKRKIILNSDDEDSDDSNCSSPPETTTSTQENFADFRNFDQMVTSTEMLHLKSSQSSPNALETNNEEPSSVEPKSKSLPRDPASIESYEKNTAEIPEIRERKIDQVRSMVDSLRERNTRLARLNQALSLELKDLISERVSLETRCDL